MTKILHILDHSLPLHSGYTFRSQNLFRAQRKMGFDPVILTSPKHEENSCDECLEKEEINHFTYYRSGVARRNPVPLLSEVWLMTVLYRRLLQVVQLEKPDILHAHSPILNAIPALLVGRKLKIPVVYEIRAFWEDAAVDHGTTSEGSLRYKLTKRAETVVCNKVDHVAILCNGLKDDLVHRGIPAAKITAVFNGVNPDDFQPCAVDDEYWREWGLAGKKVVGFIGSFYRYEGLDLLVNAFARVAKQQSETVLLLVGGGEMESELKALIGSLNLSDRVVMPGRIPHERVPGVYAMVDVLAYPRYSMRLTELVTPLKPLEAMAMGKVLVASDVGGHKELITDGETGILFKAGDEAALATSLVELLTDQAKCDCLQQQAMSWVREQHGWEKTTRVYREIYGEVFGNLSQNSDESGISR
jgi:PEP-CTERM/exosortase A-associated glycosyltransferase